MTQRNGFSPKVPLMSLSVRTSGSGNEYLAGYLGLARVVGFKGEPDKFGNPTWLIHLQEPPKKDGAAAVCREQPAGHSRDATAHGTAHPAALRAPQGANGAHAAPRRTAANSRHQRPPEPAANDFPDDPLPF